MQGLLRIPGVAELESAYAELQSTRKPLSAERVAELSQWSRFDPRLAEQLVNHLILHWKSWSPGDLRCALTQVPWPAALGVLLAHGQIHPSIPRAERKAFVGMITAVMAGFPLGDGGSFFIGTRAFAGRQLQLDAELSSRPYSAWGYLGRDLLLNKASLLRRTTHSAEQRRRVLDELIQRCENQDQKLTTRDYRAALGDRISPRLAELDLKAHPRLIPRGRTRGRVFWVRARKPRTSRSPKKTSG